jgi:ABC-type antimicrobial peptide transport system permease subunit
MTKKAEMFFSIISKRDEKSPFKADLVKGRSQWSCASRRFRRNRGAMIRLMATIIVLIAVAAPGIAPYDPKAGFT